MAVLVEPIWGKRYRLGPVCTSPYPSHMHDATEIAILRKGHINMTVNGTLYPMGPDTVMTVFPGMIHSYENASGDAEGLLVMIYSGGVQEYQNIMITQRPVVPLVRIHECPKDLEIAVSRLESYSRQEEDHPLTLAYIHLLLGCLLMNMELVPFSELKQSDLAYRVMYYVQQHAHENLTLDSVAKEMGIGRSHLSHLFTQKLHIHFRHLLNILRIEKACQMLQDPARSIKEVCFECGYVNTRTFHRVFMAEQKMTPGEYREKWYRGG